MDNENTINKDLTGTLYFTNNGNGFFAPEGISNEEYDKISKEIDSKIIQLNVINRSSWTYFDSDKISTIVYDVEIPETLYKELFPHSFDNRNINENEVACIEYRKSMLSSDQDQFLISKFDRNDFTLKQQKEIQINDELKSQIRNVCDVYEKKQSYTDAILEKFEAAGIEVITDKDEFDRIYETEDILQKMTNDEIIKNMIKQRDDAIEEKNRINAKKLGNFKTEVENSNKSKSENQIVIISKNQKNILSDSLKETAEKFVSVVYSRENYKKIFGDGVIESPIETIKLGSNQFVKISPGNRNNFMYAIRQTLENPSIILGKETWDNNSETFKPVHLYGKSFINDNNSEKLVESLIIFKEGNNIAVSLHPNGIDKFVEQIKTTNDIVYLDDEVSRVAAFAITDGDSHVVKENENFLSRVRQVSYSSLGQESYPLININYNRDSLLSSEEFISSKGIETGKLEITKDNFDRYFNILNQHDAFKDKRNRIASELYNFHVSSENKDEMKKWLEEQGYTITEKEVTQYMKNDNGLTYGFVHEGKIYLNPEIMNSNAAVHEYTHLWDAYTQKTNPELWNKGLELFKNTKYWNEVISDPNYQNIKDNENLVLSEIHSRISGEFAEQVLNRIAELDGKEVKLDAIDWDKETWLYIQNNFFDIENNEQEVFAEFLSTPMKDLVNEKNINLNIENTQTNTNDLFKDFQFDFSRPVTWHFVDNTSLIYADTFISNEQALSLFNAAGANDSYNKDMQYCIQYRCTSTDKNNLVYLCKYDPNVEITTLLKEINLPEDIIQKVISGVEAGIEEHLQQQHTIPDYLLDAVGYGDKKVVQEEVSDYSTDSNKPEGIMYLSENHNVFYAEPDLPREDYLKLSAQTDIDELKKQQSFLYTDENDDFGYQSNILEQREVYQHKIDRLQAKIDSLNGVPNPLNEIISSQLPASMTSLHSFTEEERMGQFIGMKNDFKNYATEEEIKLLDDKFKTLFIDPESSAEIKKGEEFHLLADEFESYFQDTKNKHYNVASNQYESYADVAFESDKRSVEQEPVPDFAMVTQNGLQKFTGYYIQAYSDKNDIYTLSNGSNTIELPGETIKELNKPNINEINFHGEVYSHILDHQYNDFFKYREPNIAAYFEHNLAVMIRTQAQNPLDTFKAAKEIIKTMPKNEQKITQELVKKIAASQNKSVNDLMLDIYNKAIIERPMNEEFINVNNPRNIIPRHMTDLVYISGHKIDDNSELKIGENINKVPVKAFKLNGKKQTIYLNLEVVSASKDKNLIVMKDSKENIYELPRDKILSQYEKNSIYNRRNQSVSVKHYNDSSMER